VGDLLLAILPLASITGELRGDTVCAMGIGYGAEDSTFMAGQRGLTSDRHGSTLCQGQAVWGWRVRVWKFGRAINTTGGHSAEQTPKQHMHATIMVGKRSCH